MDVSDLTTLQVLGLHPWFLSDLNWCLLYSPAAIEDAMTISFNTEGGEQREEEDEGEKY